MKNFYTYTLALLFSFNAIALCEEQVDNMQQSIAELDLAIEAYEIDREINILSGKAAVSAEIAMLFRQACAESKRELDGKSKECEGFNLFQKLTKSSIEKLNFQEKELRARVLKHHEKQAQLKNMR